jgi:hypothetical protein
VNDYVANWDDCAGYGDGCDCDHCGSDYGHDENYRVLIERDRGGYDCPCGLDGSVTMFMLDDYW